MLQSGCEMDDATHGVVIYSRVGYYRQGQNLARRYPDANVWSRADALQRAINALHYLNCCGASSHGMIIALNWRAKQRHNAIALNPVDGAAEMVDRATHQINNLLQPLGCPLRVGSTHHLRGTLNVSKHNRYDLPLPPLNR